MATSKIKTLIRNFAATNNTFGKIYERLAYIKTNKKVILSDEEYIKKRYKEAFGREIDLAAPTGYNEKLQWLKLYDHNPLYTKMVDKYTAKLYFAEKLGAEHVIPLLGVWDSVDDIDFDSLPDKFVLKCTHDSGGRVICTDKSALDYKKARKRLNDRLSQNYYLRNREWAYKNVRPRIIAEKYMEYLGRPDSVEYKVTCFNGKADFVTVCSGRAHGTFDERTNDTFDMNFNHMPWYAYYKNAKECPKKPAEFDELIRISEILSKNIPVLRVDSYIIDGVVYVGETTFYTWGGFVEFNPPEYNEILGKKIILPDITGANMTKEP